MRQGQAAKAGIVAAWIVACHRSCEHHCYSGTGLDVDLTRWRFQVASQDVAARAAVADLVPAGYSYESVAQSLQTYSVGTTAYGDQHAARAEAILNVTVGQTWASLEMTQGKSATTLYLALKR